MRRICLPARGPRWRKHFSAPTSSPRLGKSVEQRGGITLYRRAMDAVGNPEFLRSVLPGQMALARLARPGGLAFYPPTFAEGEFDVLNAGDPTLSPVGYHASTQVYEFSGHTPPGTELRCIDLFTAWQVASDHRLADGRPVREVHAVFMDEETGAPRGIAFTGRRGRPVLGGRVRNAAPALPVNCDSGSRHPAGRAATGATTMLKTFPSGNDPFVFSDTLPRNNTDTSQAMLDAHVNAFNLADFTDAVPANVAALFVTFVIFAYPNAAAGDVPPQAPIVELLRGARASTGPVRPCM